MKRFIDMLLSYKFLARASFFYAMLHLLGTACAILLGCSFYEFGVHMSICVSFLALSMSFAGKCRNSSPRGDE